MIRFNSLIRSAVILAIVLLPFFISAQSSDLGNWLIYIGNKKINNKWNLHHEVQYRNFNAIGDLEQLLLRTGLGYNLGPDGNNNILLGYGYILSSNYINDEEKININEHRIFQQFITRQKFNRFSLQHRYRLEERFVEDNYRMRFRYFLGINYALTTDADKKLSWYLSAYNEIFLNLNDTPFDRDRTYFAIGAKINKGLKLELGYMNQFFGTAGRDQINVLALANF